MKATLILKERLEIGEASFIELVIWRLPRHLRGSVHPYKYRLALIQAGVCVLRCDNEAGKGDHRHIGNREVPYQFTTLDALLQDFHQAVEEHLA